MSRRVRDGEQEFGSDSFLDIIANIVGILIILIVVAGVKVARQSAVESQAAVVEPDAAVVQADLPPPSEAPFAALTIPEPTAPDTEFNAAAQQALKQEIADLQLFLANTQQDSASSQAELQQLLMAEQRAAEDRVQRNEKLQDAFNKERELADSIFGLQTSISTAETKTASFQRTLNSLSERQSYVSDALKQVTFETRQLRETLEAVELQQPKGERINHRLSPVGQAVTDRELHFRLAGGRIAHIPLEPLLERLKTQVMARRSVVMRFHRYEGMVGPIGGFQMQYTVRRDVVSPMQSLQYGNSAYRMSVAKWTILPSDTLAAEPLADALRIGSRFRQVLEATDPDTAVTVWLYPEDFEKFRDIRELAHNLNLRVAARPLPEGTPIAGSPTGSRSTSQ